MQVTELWSDEPAVWLITGGRYGVHVERFSETGLPKLLCTLSEGHVIGAEKLYGIESAQTYFAVPMDEDCSVERFPVDRPVPQDVEAKAALTLAFMTAQLFGACALSHEKGADKLRTYLAMHGGKIRKSTCELAKEWGYSRMGVHRMLTKMEQAGVVSLKRAGSRRVIREVALV